MMPTGVLYESGVTGRMAFAFYEWDGALDITYCTVIHFAGSSNDNSGLNFYRWTT